MKHIFWTCAALALLAGASAQAQVAYRCAGNEYTNIPARIKRGDCKPVIGGNVTVVHSFAGAGLTGAAPAGVAASPRAATPMQAAARVSDAVQRTRDAGSRSILQAELDKKLTELAALQREYNNGEPEKMGAEHRNYQKYLDRVAELKAHIARTESDISNLRSELGMSGG